MKIQHIVKHLADLADFLAEAGGAGMARELRSLCEGLGPYGMMTTNEFLKTIQAKAAEAKPRPTRSAARANSTSANASAIIDEIRQIYARAGDPSLSSEAIDNGIGRLAGLKKADIVAAAEAVGLAGMKSRTIAAIVQEIRQRILARRGAVQRAELADRGPVNAREAPSHLTIAEGT
jgi:hypothetical protein